MKVILIGIFIFGVIAMRVMRAFTLEKWIVSLGLIVLASILYVLNILLIRYFIKKRAPEFANDESWEFTVGRGIVPKWVSAIGLLAISAFIMAVLPWIIALLKKFF